MPASDSASNTPSGGHKLHGRRKGRPLRPGQQYALAVQLPECEVRLPEDGSTVDLDRLFPDAKQAVWLEIGFGAGEHMVRQAQDNPNAGIIGAEVFQDGLAKAVRQIAAARLDNVRLYPHDARTLLDALPAASLDRVFILFPDPWPKTRHHKRRLVQAAYLDAVARVLADGGELRLATDDPGYQRWMAIELTRHPAFAWTATRSADWRERPADWPPTRYEEKARAAGRQPVFLRYRRRPRSAPVV